MTRIPPADWYRIRPVADGVTHIDEPFIKEFYRCNIWHVRGRDRDMLVDSGMGVVSLRAWVPLVTERPLDAVASHTHFDHIGCHHEFPCRLCHAAEAAILAAPTRDNTSAANYVSDEIFDALPPEPYQSATYGVAPAPATRILTDGDIIDLGDRHFEVIHTPGHSPGGIALWEAATGVLISGDILYDGPLIEGESPAEQAQYIASMRRLRDLPARVVHGGHFPSFSGERLRELIDDWLRTKGA
ncbi:MBL fold metallo-hydrolase [Paenirhodobacter populi]|uniref:MBL fold metallo-hydrolase n=1 Tax=Paenirhodobacter populi TaxID=2306993 RepID=UPI000FE35C2E|nr:MBL fold metallo-hydrolase [Sinirhodobacter populi]RWR07410.1 MBL fold metallo-hydrolase [Sinirhodobacter populi]